MIVYTFSWLMILAAAINFLIGFLWHGPLFGKVWTKLMGFTEAQMQEGMKKGMGMPLTLNAIANIITAFVFFNIATGLMLTGSEAVILAILAWLGFSMPIYLNDTIWGGKSWKLFWFESGYCFVTLIVTALVYSFWA